MANYTVVDDQGNELSKFSFYTQGYPLFCGGVLFTGFLDYHSNLDWNPPFVGTAKKVREHIVDNLSGCGSIFMADRVDGKGRDLFSLFDKCRRFTTPRFVVDVHRSKEYINRNHNSRVRHITLITTRR